jgi:hypothetical protein
MQKILQSSSPSIGSHWDHLRWSDIEPLFGREYALALNSEFTPRPGSTSSETVGPLSRADEATLKEIL